MVVKQLMAGSPVPILDADRLEVDTGVVSALTGLGLEDLPSGLAHLTPDTDEKDAGRRDSFHLSLVSFYLQTGQVLVGRHLVVISVSYGTGPVYWQCTRGQSLVTGSECWQYSCGQQGWR